MASHNAFVLLIQISKPSWRPLLSMYINGVDGGLFLILALLYYLLQSWKLLFVAIAVLSLLTLVVVALVIPQSPRFYLSQHKYKEARRVFRRIAKMSGKEMFSQDLLNQALFMRLSQDQSMRAPSQSVLSGQTKDSISDLWNGKSKRQKCVLLLIPLGWFTVDILSYGLNFSINDLHGDIYVFGYIIGGMSFVVALTGTFVADKLGRKGGFFLAWGFAAFGMTIYQFTQDVAVLPYILICISRYGASAAFGFCFLHTSEYFPTVFRGVMFGICNACARLGGIIAPEFSTVFFVGWFMLAFGMMALLMFILNVFNYETKGMKMKDNIGEMSPGTLRSTPHQARFEEEEG